MTESAQGGQPNTKQAPLRASISLPNFGIQGEEWDIVVAPVFEGKAEPNPAGGPGDFDVVVYLRRPDTQSSATDYSFDVDSHNGTSLLAIANPAANFADARFNMPGTRINLYLRISDTEGINATGFANVEGFLSDVRATIKAESFDDASRKVESAIVPGISALSLGSDVPLLISRTIIRETKTGVMQRTIQVPFGPATVDIQPHEQPPAARVLFNRYRDGLNSTDPNWRFLCFASILEQLWKAQKARVNASDEMGLEKIGIPTDAAEVAAWVRSTLPKSQTISDEMALEVVPPEARGLTTNEVIRKFIRPIRTSIAHSILEDGALPERMNDVDQTARVKKWLRLLRCVTRLHLRHVYGVPGHP